MGPFQKMVLALDCGTTGNRAILFDKRQHIKSTSYQEFKQYYPKPGWVEHNPNDIWKSTFKVIQNTLQSLPEYGIVKSIGITNQRETVVFWNRRTGVTLGNAIVWQDRRTASECLQLTKEGWGEKFRNKTGLVIDPYFSATKISWALGHEKAIKQCLKLGHLCIGTIDSWLIWCLTGGKSRFTRSE